MKQEIPLFHLFAIYTINPPLTTHILSLSPRFLLLPCSRQAAWIAGLSQITDNSNRKRFELIEEGKLAFADYRLQGEILVLPHVEADPALRGRGTAGRLMEGVLETARSRGWKVSPVCGYAAAYIRRHPEHHDLLA